MRLTTTLKTALSATAALALLTACGGGSDDSADSTSSATTTSSSAAEETSEAPDAEAAAFCSDAEAAFGELEGIATTTDPTTIPAAFADISAKLSAIEPPAEIADAWGTVTGALEGAVASVQGLDLTTPEGQQAFSAAFSQLETQASAEQAQVEEYVTANCDLPTESASATS